MAFEKKSELEMRW